MAALMKTTECACAKHTNAYKIKNKIIAAEDDIPSTSGPRHCVTERRRWRMKKKNGGRDETRALRLLGGRRHVSSNPNNL